MDNVRHFFQKILSLLRVRSVVAGLEIGDDVLRLAYLDGGIWKLHAVRLEPGVLESGKIKDRDRLFTALADLKTESKIGGRNKKKKINVVVSMSSAHMYSQVFNLPILAGDALVKAVDLNLQMASPSEVSKTYSGWEVVGKDESIGRLDVLSAFVDRDIVDDMVQALFTVGFLAMAVEPRSIALTRILREKGAGIDSKKPYLFLDIDNIGIDFLVIRNGLPYFEYTNLWRDVADESGEISLQKFEEELGTSLRQVINFYNQHWGEPLEAVIIAATTLHESIEKTVAANAAFPAVRLTLEMGQPISSEWLVGIGCSLRGVGSKGEEGEISLLGVEWEDRFQEEQIFEFTRFWEVLMPIVFGILVVLFFVANSFVVATRVSIEADSGFSAHLGQTAEITAFEASTTQFNTLVTVAQSAENSVTKTSALLGAVQSTAEADGIMITHFSFSSTSTPASLSGSASSEDRVIAFRNDLGSVNNISGITLPPASLQNNGGAYTFQMTFNYSGE
jgi:hypothetical protein